MQRLEVSCAVRHIYVCIYIYMSLGAKRLILNLGFESLLNIREVDKCKIVLRFIVGI